MGNYDPFVSILVIYYTPNCDSLIEKRPSSYTTKVYERGTYTNPQHLSTFNESSDNNTEANKKPKIDHHHHPTQSDPLSQSLPSWSLKTLKKDEKEVKCVYDSRQSDQIWLFLELNRVNFLAICNTFWPFLMF